MDRMQRMIVGLAGAALALGGVGMPQVARAESIEPQNTTNPSPSTDSAPARITGVVQFALDDESPQPLADLTIALVAAAVPGDTVASDLQNSIPIYQELIAHDEENLEELKRSHERQGAGGYFNDRIAAAKRSIEAYQSTVETIQVFCTTPPEEMDTLEAIRLVRSLSATGESALPSGMIVIQQTQSDAAGRFTLADLPPGEHYLMAFLRSDSAKANWVLPVILVEGQEQAVDLNPTNAEMIDP